MARRAYARRYAQAAFAIALEANELDKWQSDLMRLASLAEDAALVAWLENPKVRFEDKARPLSGQMGDIHPLVLNLAYLLVAKGRFGMMTEITAEYRRLLDSHHGIEQAEVVTTVPLDDADKLRLGERLSALVDKKVVVKAKVDPQLIGGLVVKVGGKLLDGSTRSKLAALRKEMAGSG
ncbi:MAG: F0F1 ATP synthase subunit delta [Chloroflexi bacterium]|nr:F0F1 ATP synthase subunit delta [Chloroflexota bacterium]